jgi:molybdenum cofactor guanylyltransferase
MATGLTLGILAGGRGQRLGGQDKGWLLRDGQSQIERLLQQHAAQADRVVISANRNLEAYGVLASVVSDQLAGFPGPFAGVQALLSAAVTDYLLTLPVDAVDVPGDYAPRMMQLRDTSEYSVVVAQDDEGMQPLFALYPVALAAHALAALESGTRSVREWQHRFPVQPCRFDGARFGNINTPDDLRGA